MVLVSGDGVSRFTLFVRMLRHRYRFDARWKRWLAVIASVMSLGLVLSLFTYLFVAIVFAGAAVAPGTGLYTWGYEPPLDYPVFRIPWWMTTIASLTCSTAMVILTAVSVRSLDAYRIGAMQGLLLVGGASLPPVFAMVYAVEWGVIPFPWNSGFFFGPEIWAAIPGFVAIFITVGIRKRAFRSGNLPLHSEWAADADRALR